MSWDYEISDEALKQLRKMGGEGRRRILKYLDDNISGCEDPRQFGKALTGDLGELWRYRTSHYRMICKIQDERLVVLVVRAGHRRNVYD